jgi:hypothetical protein
LETDISTVSDAGNITVNGDYPNLSKFIRVEVEDGVANASNDKIIGTIWIPFINITNTNGSGSSINLQAVSYKHRK